VPPLAHLDTIHPLFETLHCLLPRREHMTTNVRRTVQLGDLVVAAFDRAAKHSADPREVSRLATQAVKRILRHARRTSTLPSLPTTWIMAASASQWAKSS